jgi:hypothetical protein
MPVTLRVQPWQMTREEWLAAIDATRIDWTGSQGTAGASPAHHRLLQTRLALRGHLPDRRIDTGDGDWLQVPADHRDVVLAALGRGLPVPAHVLAEYPELARANPTPTAWRTQRGSTPYPCRGRYVGTTVRRQGRTYQVTACATPARSRPGVGQYWLKPQDARGAPHAVPKPAVGRAVRAQARGVTYCPDWREDIGRPHALGVPGCVHAAGSMGPPAEEFTDTWDAYAPETVTPEPAPTEEQRAELAAWYAGQEDEARPGPRRAFSSTGRGGNTTLDVLWALWRAWRAGGNTITNEVARLYAEASRTGALQVDLADLTEAELVDSLLQAIADAPIPARQAGWYVAQLERQTGRTLPRRWVIGRTGTRGNPQALPDSAGGTRRVIWRCPGRHVWATDYQATGGPHAVLWREVQDPATGATTRLRMELDDRCPTCGRAGQPSIVRGHYRADIPCTAKCLAATGPDCQCSCAGRNHGRGHLARGNPGHEAGYRAMRREDARVHKELQGLTTEVRQLTRALRKRGIR